MKNRLNYKGLIYSFIAIIFLILLLISGGLTVPALADSTRNTNVLDDLQKDANFNVNDYPSKADDYSIDVIQIAESAQGNLFIYVYQPAALTKKLTLTKVNMALSKELSNEDTSYIPTGNEFVNNLSGGHGGGGSVGCSLAAPLSDTETPPASTKLYQLRFLNENGVFAKYLVRGLKVREETERYYRITSVYRPWDSAIDDPADNDNTISAVACKVGQLWTATTTSDGVTYTAKEIEVIELTSQMIGVHRYSDGVQFENSKACDSHYIAFTANKPMDRLISADVEFHTRTYKAFAGEKNEYGSRVYHRTTLYDYQVESNDGSGWFGNKQEWHRINSVKKFKEEVKLSDEENKNLEPYDWILNFYSSEFTVESGHEDVLVGLLPFGEIWTIFQALTTTGEIVVDVSVLRLEYEYSGKIYNVGVVSDIQTGSNKPVGGLSFFEWLAQVMGVPEWAAKLIFALIILVIVFGILLPILSAAFPIVGVVVKYFFIGLWYVISSPVRLIIWIVQKARGNKSPDSSQAPRPKKGSKTPKERKQRTAKAPKERKEKAPKERKARPGKTPKQRPSKARTATKKGKK